MVAVDNLAADYSRRVVLHMHHCIRFAVDRSPGCIVRILAARIADNPHIVVLAAAGCSIAGIVTDCGLRTVGTVAPVETIAHLAGKCWRPGSKLSPARLVHSNSGFAESDETGCRPGPQGRPPKSRGPTW